MASLKYWLWLTTRKGLRPEHAVRLLEHFGTPEGAYFADPGEYDLLSDLPLPVRTALQEKHLAEAEGILADCERLGLRILTLGDADYPDRLKNIYDPPAVLYVKGRLPAFDEEIAVAVVGSMFSFPVLGSKCAPIQHMVNVICAVFLGPAYGVGAAFVASLLRNLLGLGSLIQDMSAIFRAEDPESLSLTYLHRLK